MKKKTKVLLGIIAVLAVIVAIGPLILGGIARYVINHPPKTKKALMDTTLRMKVHGKISLLAGNTLLTTPESNRTYILVGNSVNELKKYANSDQNIFVFGSLMLANPKEVNGTKIVFNIDVSKFDIKDFSEQALSAKKLADMVQADKAMAEAEQQKVVDARKQQEEANALQEAAMKKRIAFRDQVLSKVGKKSPNMDVIAGKLKIGTCLLRGQEAPCMLVQDKEGVIYILSNRYKAINASVNDFLKYKNMDMHVVVVGQFGVADEDIVVPQYPSRMTFVMTGIYTEDLKPFIQ